MTEKAIPILAKKAITQDVHPYVKMPNKIDINPKVDPFPSLPFSSTIDVERCIKNADNKLIKTFKDIFKTTKYVP